MHRSPLTCILVPMLLCSLSCWEARAAEKDKPVISEAKKEKALRTNDRAAQEAMARDAKLFNNKEFSQLEADYQAASARYREPDAVEALQKFLARWTKGNRVGCATLYLAQKSRGPEREKLLQECIEKYSDCYYLNGCQVGGLARLFLLDSLKAAGKQTEADKLLAEIKDKYALANDHSGRLIIEILEATPQ